MARIARAVVPDYPHHVTQRGVRGMDLFRHDADRNEYLRLLREQSERFGVKFLGWCLMTNHVHLVALPRAERALALAVGEAHRRYTRMVNFREEVRGHLFQERFHSCVLDERHLLAAARYVEQNPVRAGLVGRPEEWPWSSALAHLDRGRHDPLVSDLTLLGLVPDAAGWRSLLTERDAEAEGHLRVATRTGRPAGDGKFLIKVAKATGRDLARRRAGRHPQPARGAGQAKQAKQADNK